MQPTVIKEAFISQELMEMKRRCYTHDPPHNDPLQTCGAVSWLLFQVINMCSSAFLLRLLHPSQ